MKNTEFAEMALLTELREKGKLSVEEEYRLNTLTHKMQSEKIRAGYNPADAPRERDAKDKAFTRYLRSGAISPELERRDDPVGMSADVNTQGGYTVPEDFWHNLQIALKAYGGTSAYMRQVTSDSGAPMPWPTLDPTGVKASLVAAENTQLTLDNPYVFGQGTMNAYTIATDPFLVSYQMLQDSDFDVDALATQLIGEAIGRKLADYALTGDGGSEPLGVYAALTARGAVSTSGGWLQLGAATPVNVFGAYGDDATTELVANALSPATVGQMVKSINSAYLPNARFHLSTTQAINQRSVVDDNGRPLLSMENGWTGGPGLGQMFGFPVVVDDGIPALVASTVGGPVFGDLNAAFVMRTVRTGASVMRLNERYADYLAAGFIGYVRVDMRANDVRALVTVKAAST